MHACKKCLRTALFTLQKYGKITIINRTVNVSPIESVYVEMYRISVCITTLCAVTAESAMDTESFRNYIFWKAFQKKRLVLITENIILE